MKHARLNFFMFDLWNRMLWATAVNCWKFWICLIQFHFTIIVPHFFLYELHQNQILSCEWSLHSPSIVNFFHFKSKIVENTFNKLFNKYVIYQILIMSAKLIWQIQLGICMIVSTWATIIVKWTNQTRKNYPVRAPL